MKLTSAYITDHYVPIKATSGFSLIQKGKPISFAEHNTVKNACSNSEIMLFPSLSSRAAPQCWSLATFS